MRKICFLDLDGVLIPTTFHAFLEQWGRISKGGVALADEYMDFFAPHCVHNIRSLLSQTGAGIVFTTNRRTETDLARMWAHRYDPDVVVLGNTPKLDNKNFTRGDEISRWLAEYQEPVSSYVIIDDMGPTNFHPAQHKHLVVCDERFGFTKQELAQALKVLAGRELWRSGNNHLI
ncbi:hypothetical protein E4631_18265 [Hymenobacter sp. UV11]|uniref:HAD domain-containing protein n=1 Tax=Hymenobacter sp. UV11 TaxID=1849735 RepID=UPI001060F6CB|nr:HAD domain-containing protein [Hymenobacter sp. UV11]TFZ64929.1 hypothetical protein E4631_18265 [Hymenobacter sp. UV11]